MSRYVNTGASNTPPPVPIAREPRLPFLSGGKPWIPV